MAAKGVAVESCQRNVTLGDSVRCPPPLVAVAGQFHQAFVVGMSLQRFGIPVHAFRLMETR
jgi:hypothetical protein